MRFFYALILFMVLSLTSVFVVNAQTAETIWIQSNTTSYKTGETIVVIFNATADTPVQGFTFQIRYDPACLTPMNSSSPVPGMNGLPLPQVSGLVDASYASNTPQVVNGVLAEVYFQALAGCQTNVTLESAALVIRNAEGFAVPLPNVAIIGNNIALNIDKEVGVAQPVQPLGASLPLEPTKDETTNNPIYGWAAALLAVLFIAGSGYIFVKGFRSRKSTAKPVIEKKVNSLQRSDGNLQNRSISLGLEHYQKKITPSSGIAKVHFKHGPYSGESFALDKLPFFIGRDPRNDLCLNDPHVLSHHAKIFETSNGYYLMDLGGGTYVNGQMVKRNSAILKTGDVVRLGKSALFVFGS